MKHRQEDGVEVGNFSIALTESQMRRLEQALLAVPPALRRSALSFVASHLPAKDAWPSTWPQLSTMAVLHRRLYGNLSGQ